MKILILKIIDNIFGKILCLFIGWLDYIFRWTKKNNKIDNPVKKILIIRPGGMGDFLYLLPSLKILKTHFPNVKLDILVEKRNKAVCDLTDAIDCSFAYDLQPLKTLKALISGNYDIVIDTEQFHHFSAVFSYITSASVRIGFKTNASRNHLYTHLTDYYISGNEIYEFLRLLKPLGIEKEYIDIKEYVLIDKIKNTQLPEAFINFKKKFDKIVIIAPRWGDKYRQWDLKKYIKVTNYLLKNYNVGIVFIGSKEEALISKKIIKNISINNNQLLSLLNRTTFMQLCHIFLESNLYIGCDSGTAVLSCTLGLKSIIIFGVNYESKWSIDNLIHIVVRKKLSCSPCYILGKQKLCKDIDCMKHVEAVDVTSKIDNLI